MSFPQGGALLSLRYTYKKRGYLTSRYPLGVAMRSDLDDECDASNS